MGSRERTALGNPDLGISGLRIWVHGRRFPDATDYWDGNWLGMTACYSTPASVRALGSIVHLAEIRALLRELKGIHQHRQGHAELHCLEPALDLEFQALANGHLQLRIVITADTMTGSHSFVDQLDYTALPSVIAGCNAILARFPLYEPDALAR